MFFLQLFLAALIILIIYQNITSYRSWKSVVLLCLFALLIKWRLVLLATYPSRFFIRETFYDAAFYQFMIFIFFSSFILYLGKKKADLKTKKILSLFLLYLPFSFLQQLFFQTIILESLLFLLHRVLVTVFIASVFFVLFHIPLKKKKSGHPSLHTAGMWLWYISYSLIYIYFGNILWIILFHALLGAIYYSLTYRGNILKTRLEISY